MSHWIELVEPFLLEPLPQGTTQKQKANFVCPHCGQPRLLSIVNWVRKFKTQNESHKGWCLSCICKLEERRESLSRKLKGRPGKPHTEKAKEKIREVQLKHWNNPQFKEPRLSKIREMWQDPEFRQRHYLASNTDEVKQKRRTALEEVWSDKERVENQSVLGRKAWEENRELRLERIRAPEVLEKRRNTLKLKFENLEEKQAWANRLQSSRTPERLSERCTLTAEEQSAVSTRFKYLGYKNSRHHLECLKCGFISKRKRQRYGRDCSFCYDQRTCKTENSIKDWLLSLGFPSTKLRIQRKELDIFIESLGLAIEYCGLHWHNENSPEPRLRNYHRDKMLLAKSHGIKLITIFEDEWLERQPQVKGFLLSVLKLNAKIPARKCRVSEIDKVDAFEFLDAFHIQGPVQGSTYLGLYFESDLVGVLVGGSHHRGNEGAVLKRLCFKSGLTVVGGASKLFKVYRNIIEAKNLEKIISWSDNRWTTGGIYQKLGFALKAELGPDYQYVKRQKRYSKQSLRKTNAEVLSGKTEKELREEQGYNRIWDCGKKTWECSTS